MDDGVYYTSSLGRSISLTSSEMLGADAVLVMKLLIFLDLDLSLSIIYST